MKKIVESRNFKIVISILIIVGFTSILFLHTVSLRKRWRTTLSLDHHQALTGHTLLTTKNWYREGAWKLRFASLWNPKSIEFKNLEDRGIYPSYPPGTFLPIYLIGIVKGSQPRELDVMKYNLMNHYLIALFLSFIVFVMALRAKLSFFNSTVFAFIPSIIELYFPAPLYWHQNVFFADQAVIFPFVFLVFLEVLPNKYRRTLSFRVLFSLTIFYGTLTDWLFILVVLILYAKRVLCKEIRFKKINHFLVESFVILFPAGFALTLFLIQIGLLDVFGLLYGKFLTRSGLKYFDETSLVEFSSRFFNDYISYGFGRTSVILLWGSLIILLFLLAFVIGFIKTKTLLKFKLMNIIGISLLIILPCFLQVYTLQQHSYEHDFSALKFSVPFASIPFALLPIIFVFFINAKFQELQISSTLSFGKYNIIKPMSTVILFIIVVSYTYHNHPRFRSFFPEPNYEIKTVGAFIEKYTSDNDVVFSTTTDIDIYPPQKLSYSMKRVYPVDSLEEVLQFLKDKSIGSDYTINIFETEDSDHLAGLKSIAKKFSDGNGLELYKIRKEQLLNHANSTD